MTSDQGLSKAAQPSSAAAERRRERRLNIAVPVKVFFDASSADFQTCCTYEISTGGARLVAPSTGLTQAGQILFLQRNNRRARFKVVWIGKPGTKHASQVGVETMEPNNVIWENEIKARLMQVEAETEEGA